jgi:serine/threonine protein kinase
MIISHFKILRKLDEGGMGKIYLAEDTVLNRQVALKFLPSNFTSNKELIDRFKREARAAAALKHPNIVTVYELAKHQEQFYIAMEYVDGVSLCSLMEQRQISVDNAVIITTQICRGLRKAHQSGIIHRDIKPANVMIDKEGWVKILDFGLAKLTENTRITRYGVRMGTAPYSSPEQFRGEELGPSSDIFSLGVLLYQLLTGLHPFDGNTEDEVLYSILHRTPKPLSKYKPDVSPGLQKIIDKALKKEPRNRYQSVDEILSDLKKERRAYSRKEKPKNPMMEVITMNIRDIETNFFRVAIAKFKASFLVLLIRSKLGASKISGAKFTKPLLLAFLLIVTVALTLSFPGLRNKLFHRTPSQFSPIQTLMKVKETPALLKSFEKFRRQNLISMGNNVDFALLENCYLFVFDSLKVLEVFEIKDNLMCSLKSREKFTTPPKEFSGKTKIWVQDLTVRNQQKNQTRSTRTKI